MKYLFKLLTLILLPLLYSGNAFAQATGETEDFNKVIVPPSPTAAELGKYGEIPVNKSTGVPSISIPLFELNHFGYSIPLSLSYHAGGNTVLAKSTNVGLGWSLNAGGVISRTMRVAPDDLIDGYLYFCQDIPTRDNVQSDLGDINERDNTIFSLLTPVANGQKDMTPDQFSYNVNGQTGTFMFNLDRQPVFFPYNNVKVKVLSGGNEVSESFVGTIDEFVLTDKQGIQYSFGTAGAIESQQVDVQGREIPTYNSSWYLTEIKLPHTTERITFEYTTYTDVYSNGETFFVQYKSDINGYTVTTPAKASGSTTYLNGVHLSKITYAKGHIQVNYQDKLVTSIGHYDKFNNLLKKYELSHLNLDGRSFLKAVTEIGDKGTAKPPYVFKYNTTPLPPRSSYAQDHWGYYNGANGNQNLIPQMEYGGYTLGYADREPNEAMMKARILEEIEYPTGGLSRFFYEMHDYHFGSEDKVAGGLRIDRIENYIPETDQTQVRTFTYLAGLVSSPVSSGYKSGAGINYLTDVYSRDDQCAETELIRIGSNPQTGGSPVAYRVVQEYIGDAFSNHQGYTETEFLTGYDAADPDPPFLPRVSMAWKRSLVKAERVFDVEGSLLSETINSYEEEEIPGDSVHLFKAARLGSYETNKCGGFYSDQFAYGDYTFFSKWHYLAENQRISYDDNGLMLQADTYYEYDHQSTLLKRTTQEIKNDKLETLTTELRYPGEMTGTEYEEMVAAHMIGLPVEQIRYRNSSELYKVKTSYKKHNGLFLQDQVEKSYPSGERQVMVSFEQYDSIGNLLQTTDATDVVTSYIWGYDSKYPVIKVQGIEHNSLWPLMSREDSVIVAEISPSMNDQKIEAYKRLQTQLAEALVVLTGYTYNLKGQVTSITDPNGKTTHYAYDDLGRLLTIKDDDENLVEAFEYHYRQ